MHKMYRIVGQDTSEDGGYLVLDNEDLTIEAAPEGYLLDCIASKEAGTEWLKDKDSILWCTPDDGKFRDTIRVSDEDNEFLCMQFEKTDEDYLYIYLLSQVTGVIFSVSILRLQGTDESIIPVENLNLERVITTEEPIAPSSPNEKVFLFRVSSAEKASLQVYKGNSRQRPMSPNVPVKLYRSEEDDTYKGYFVVTVDTDKNSVNVVDPSTEGFRKRPYIKGTKLMYEGTEVADLVKD